MNARSTSLSSTRQGWRARRLSIVAVVTLAAASLAAGVAAQERVGVSVGREAPEFTLESIDGSVHGLGDLRGEKNVIVVFFRGTW